MRFVPYVAPYARFALSYNTTKGGSPIPGLEQILEHHKVRGGGASIGAGIRVPIIKWISVAIGGEIAGTFALTIHPI